MNGYELSRIWFNWCFENPEKIRPNHTALYFFIIEHCNRLGWKEKFGLPTTMVMEAVGIKSYNTYIDIFNDLIKWKFIIIIEKSKNQYSSNIIALSKNNKALDKALDKALIKHNTKQIVKQHESTIQSISSIIKQINNKQITIEQLTNKQIIFLKKFLNKKDEDINKDEEIIYPFTSENFLNYWDIWKQFKKEQFKFTYKFIGEQATLKQLSELSKNNEEIAIKIIYQSIANGWRGLFGLRNNIKIDESKMDEFRRQNREGLINEIKKKHG